MTITFQAMASAHVETDGFRETPLLADRRQSNTALQQLYYNI